MAVMSSTADSDRDVPALGRTRRLVLEHLLEARTPVAASDVADDLGVHTNSARFHLDGLVEDGLATRLVEDRRTQGRPRVLYRASAAAWRIPPADFRQLAEALLAHFVEGAPDPSQAALSAGRSWADQLISDRAEGPEPSTAGWAAATELLRSAGFESDVEETDQGPRLRVWHCPYLESVHSRDSSVCGMHRGLLDGVLAATEPGLVVNELEPLVTPTTCLATFRHPAEPAY